MKGKGENNRNLEITIVAQAAEADSSGVEDNISDSDESGPNKTSVLFKALNLTLNDADSANDSGIVTEKENENSYEIDKFLNVESKELLEYPQGKQRGELRPWRTRKAKRKLKVQFSQQINESSSSTSSTRRNSRERNSTRVFRHCCTCNKEDNMRVPVTKIHRESNEQKERTVMKLKRIDMFSNVISPLEINAIYQYHQK